MDINLPRSPNTKTSASDAHHPPEDVKFKRASDALPLPLYLTNRIFFILFLSVAYFLLHRWRDKIHTSTPLHVLSLSEISALFCLVASVIYLLGFFGIDFVQSLFPAPLHMKTMLGLLMIIKLKILMMNSMFSRKTVVHLDLVQLPSTPLRWVLIITPV